MARGINKVILVGNLGADPDTRYMPSGKAVTNIRIATSESWKDKQTGDQQERTEWHSIVMYDKLGEIAAEYLRKGSQVYIEGKLRTRKWQDKEGKDRYTTEIIADQMQMLGGRGGGAGCGWRWWWRGPQLAPGSGPGRGPGASVSARRSLRRRHSVLRRGSLSALRYLLWRCLRYRLQATDLAIRGVCAGGPTQGVPVGPSGAVSLAPCFSNAIACLFSISGPSAAR